MKDAFRKILIAIGSLVAVSGAGVGGVATWRSGWLEELTPDPPVIQPVTVAIRGPSFTVRGDTAYFVAATAGKVGKPTWKVMPAGSGTLHVEGDCLSASFRSLDSGVFTLSVSVGGEGLQVASDSLEFENLNLNEDEPITDADADARFLAELQQMTTPAVHIPTVPELAQAALEQVVSETRAEDARIIAGCFRSVINRLESGLVAPDVDPMNELDIQVTTALGDRSKAWTEFMRSVDGIFHALRDQGEITTAASTVPTLTEVLGVLVHAR